MATSGNGTFIPMVSSSPPPMDDVAFDDDDDEFSNFSSAPLGLDSPPGKWAGSNKGSFEPIKSDPTDPFHSTDDSEPSNKDGDFGTFATFGSSSFSHDKQNSNAKLVSNNNVGLSLNGNESDEEDEFADFASFTSHSVGGSNKKDGSSIDSGRQNEENVTPSSIVLNKNNSHENCESHNTDYQGGMEKRDSDSDVKREHLNQGGYSDDSTSPSGMSPHSEMPPTGIKTAYQQDGSTFADFHSRIPSKSSFDFQESAHKHKDIVRDNNESDVQGIESELSAAHLEKPSTGSLSLFRESDRQTFDSGIDSIMTPSDSSPEGKDDCSGKEICEEEDACNNPSQDIGPDTGNNDEWGDFDTFSSTEDNQTKQSLEKDMTETVRADAEMPSSKIQSNDGFGSHGSHSQARTQQQPSVTDDAGKGVLSNSESLHKSNSGNITSSLSTPQNKTPVQCDGDDDDDDFGNFSNAKQASTDNVIPSTKQDNNDDDFDDFGDFASTKSTSEHERNKQVQDKSDDNWGKFSCDNTQTPAAADDFGDFGSFGSNTGSAFGASSAEEPRDDEFGTFSSNDGSRLGQTTKSSSKSDDFGSFGSSRPVSGSLGSGTGSVSSKIPPGGRVERLFKSCFPRSMEGTSSNQPVNILQDIVTAINKQLPSKGKADKSTTTNGMVWHSLSDMENTMAQKYHWNDSKNSGKLLSSLGIDSRNILPPGRGGRPLFAQELGMLTPSKPGEISDKIPLGGGGASGDVSSGAEDGMSTTSSVTEDTVPKVEFDWSNSGLINPLDANSLNLDFFATERKSSSSRHKSRSVQKVDPELLDFAVSPSDPPLQPALTPSSSSSSNQSSTSSSQRKSPNALDEILKHSSSSMVKQKPKREAGLSSEANAVLDSLPDLSYMLAKVLMFPVSSSHSSSPSKTTKGDAGPGTSGWAESIS